MRRLVAALAVAATLPMPSAPATYAGQIRTATATFRLRGVDGHTFTFAITTRSSGIGGTDSYLQAELMLSDCAGTRCTTSQWVTPLDDTMYAESADLSITVVSIRLGSAVFQVGWSSNAGYGSMPPAATTSGGAGVVSGREATAYLIGGPLYGKGFAIVARCAALRARVASSVGAFTTDPPHGAWPSSAPRGLDVTARSRHFFRCG